MSVHPHTVLVIPLYIVYELFGNLALYGIRASQWISSDDVITRAHSFARQNLTNSATNLVNSAAHRGKADEIWRVTVDTQLNFRSLIKS